jgi:hypothetical protein
MRVNYNLYGEHSKLRKTPTQKAGIQIESQIELQRNKFENLIRLLVKNKKMKGMKSI